MSATGDNTRFWDRKARKYAADPIKDMAGYERTLERTRQLIEGRAAVLEIGCGTGTTALRLAASVERLIGTDVSGEMIAIAREKAEREQCRNVEFVVADAATAPGAAGAYDAVLAFNVLHLVADRRAALGHVHRLLKPGGLLISKTPCLAEMSILIRLAVPVAQVFKQAPDVAFFDAGKLEADVAAAGFTVQERARHGSGRKDPRILIVAAKPEAQAETREPGGA